MDSVVVSAIISIGTLAVAWFALRQKVGVDSMTSMREEMRDLRSKLAEVTAHANRLQDEHETCQELLHDTRARYEQKVEDLSKENLLLMRRALRLDEGA